MTPVCHISGLDPSKPSHHQKDEVLLDAGSNPTTTVRFIIRDSRYAASLYFLAGSFLGRGLNGQILSSGYTNVKGVRYFLPSA
jgi:hypothetical protein